MLDHVAINVRDIDVAKAFYLNALEPLGYEVFSELDGHVGLQAGGHPDLGSTSAGSRAGPSMSPSAPTGRRSTPSTPPRSPPEARDNGPPGLRTHYHEHYYGRPSSIPTATTSRPSATNRSSPKQPQAGFGRGAAAGRRLTGGEPPLGSVAPAGDGDEVRHHGEEGSRSRRRSIGEPARGGVDGARLEAASAASLGMISASGGVVIGTIPPDADLGEAGIVEQPRIAASDPAVAERIGVAVENRVRHILWLAVDQEPTPILVDEDFSTMGCEHPPRFGERGRGSARCW